MRVAFLPPSVHKPLASNGIIMNAPTKPSAAAGLIVLSAAFFLSTPAQADEVVADSSFGTGGVVSFDFAISDQAQATLLQPDGNLLVLALAQGAPVGYVLARFLPDGSLDPAFGTGGALLLPIPGSVSFMALQADGSIVLAGNNTTFAPPYDVEATVARLTAAGVLDTTFGSGGITTIDLGFDETPRGLCIQADGKIVVTAVDYAIVHPAVVIRLLTDGSLDTTFDSDGVVSIPAPVVGDYLEVTRTFQRADGSLIVIGGRVDGTTLDSYAWAKALDASGAPITGFGTASIAEIQQPASTLFAGHDLVEAVDGRLFILGQLMPLAGGGNTSRLLGLDGLGAPLGTGLLSDLGQDVLGSSLHQRADGSMIGYGYEAVFPTFEFISELVYFSRDGVRITDFGTGGIATPAGSEGRVMAMDGDHIATAGNDGSGNDLIIYAGNLVLGSWFDHGPALAGSGGAPRMTGHGTLSAGDAVHLEVTGAASSAPAFVVIGSTAIDAPFKMGTMVPSPGMILSLSTSPSGEIFIDDVLPAGIPAAAEFYVQTWIADASGPANYTSTNGLRLVAP